MPSMGRANRQSRRKAHRSAGDIISLSEALSELAARARAVEQSVRASEANGRADLEARVAEARKAADQRADDLHAKSQDVSDEAARSWTDVQRSWNEHVERVRERFAAKKAELDVKRAKRRAEDAE